MNTARIFRHRALWFGLSGVGALMVGGSLAALGTGSSSAAPGPSPKPSRSASPSPSTTLVPSATASPAPQPPSTPEPTPAKKVEEAPQPPPPAQPRTLPPGQKVDADPVRVATDDHSCLNVRPQPGTTFATEPYSCLADNTLLWLYGPEKKVDGETWRYALGAGWVASKYTKPTAAPRVALPPAIASVTMWSEIGDGTNSGTRVALRQLAIPALAFGAEATFPHVEWGLGGKNPEVSPSGEYVAVSNNKEPGRDGSVGLATLVGRVSDGARVEIPDAWPASWSRDGKLLLTIQTACDAGCKYGVSYYDTANGETVSVLPPSAEAPSFAWAADGKSIYMLNGRTLSRVALNGVIKVITDSYAENVGFYAPQASPSGRSFLVGGGYGPLNILDAANGQIREFKRAEQRQIGGKCGGTFSVSTGWLDDNRIFYHERSSATKEDGITIGDLRTGARRVLPFYNVADLNSPASGMLSFSTFVYLDDLVFSVTFLADTNTGDSVPVFTGGGAVWAH